MNKHLTTEVRVERYSWKIRSKESWGYVVDQGAYQLLVKRWKWCGITVWKRTLGREDIPMHALIDVATLGSTTWRSKFHEFIK